MVLWLNICVPIAGPLGLRAALACLVALNRLFLRTNPSTPRLYESGVCYLRDAENATQDRPHAELWLTIPDAMRLGGADCKVLAAWRVAELLEAGEHAECELIQYGPTWHVVVKRNGVIEDPSKRLGMRGAA